MNFIAQAGRAAKPEPKPYQWRVIAPDAIVSRLVGIVEGCLAADAADRSTVQQVIDALTALQREVGIGGDTMPIVDALTGGGTSTASGSGSHPDDSEGATVMASASASGTIVTVEHEAPPDAVHGDDVTYDTIELLTGLTSIGVDDAVIVAALDLIGHLAVSSLEVLKSCGAAPTKGLTLTKIRRKVRRMLTPREDYVLVREDCRV